MPTWRRSGGIQVPPATTCSPMWTVPSSGASKPAIRRRRVVFPQPLGPSSATNSPLPTSMLAKATAPTAPKLFETRSSRIMVGVMSGAPYSSREPGRTASAGQRPIAHNGAVGRTLAVVVLALLAGPAAGAQPLVCLDRGHASRPNLTTEPIGPGSSIRKIKDGGGASGEARVVMQIAWKARTLLVRRGYRVAMTRKGPTFGYGAGGNVDRARFCNRRAAALMIRIHADGS